VLEVPFARPRARKDVLEHPDYYRLREKLIGFLESQEHRGEAPAAKPAAPPRKESAAGTQEGSEPPIPPFSRIVVRTNGN
jgi:hypothetical protein